MGAPPHAPGDFLPDEKVTKESPRGVSPLGTPLGGPSEKCFTFRSRSPCSTSCCYPLKRVCDTNPDRFATLSLWSNRSFFLPEIGRSHTFCYQTVARQRGPISGQLQRKQRKHRTFLTLFLYTILKYLFIKILCFRCSWLINGVIKPFVSAQNLHKTGTELHRTPARRRNTPSPIPHLAPKLHPNVQPNPPRHGLTAQNLFSVKPKKKTRPILPQPQSGKSVFFCGRKQPGASRSAASAKRAVTPHRQVQGRSPWRAFGDFPRDGKVTRGGGAERPLMGVWGPPAPTSGSEEPSLTTCSRGAASLASVAAGGLPAPHKLRGVGRSAHKSWVRRGPRPCTIPLRCRKIPP